jgi:DNA-directed RNA polymerase sigma subunit (sigma70/sigma32)
MQKKRERFLNQTRNGRQIIELWNSSHETLNSIAKSLKPPITRERVRQILKKANEMGIVVMSKLEKSKKKKDHSLLLISNQYQSEFIDLYNQGYANTEIMRSIGISGGELHV